MSASAFACWLLGICRVKSVDIDDDGVREGVVAGVGDWDAALLGVCVFVGVCVSVRVTVGVCVSVRVSVSVWDGVPAAREEVADAVEPGERVRVFVIVSVDV